MLVIVFGFSFQSHVLAANKTWDGGASSANWEDANNWNANGVPASTDTVQINHAWQAPVSSFTVDLGGVERVITGGTLTIAGSSPSIFPTIQNGYFTTGGTAAITAQNTTITAGIRGTASNYLLGNINFTNVIYNNTTYAWECRGKTWLITGGQTTQNKILSVKSATSGSVSGTVTFTGATPGHQFDSIIIGEYADGTTRFATLNIQNGAVIKALNTVNVGLTGVTGGYGRLALDSATLIATRDFILDAKGTFTCAASTIEFRPGNTYSFSIRSTTSTQFDGEGLTLKAFPETAKTAQIEVAGVDLGASIFGFQNNYSLNEMQIGENASSTVKLVDAYNNNGGTWITEALYVDTLNIVGNTTLDLNGKKLYYRTLVNSGGYTLTQLNGTITEVSTGDVVIPGDLVNDPPTLICLSARWYLSGDANRNASVAVEYRVNGSGGAWTPGIPMLRIGNEVCGVLFTAGAYNYSHAYTTTPMFAGSIMDLSIDTEYEIRFTMNDTDGLIKNDGSIAASDQRTVVMRTRKVPVAVTTGTERHVYPPGWPGAKLSPNYTGLRDAYTVVQNGDIITVHAGTYAIPNGEKVDNSGAYVANMYDYLLDKEATASAPITIRSAGDGTVLFDGDEAKAIFNMRRAKHHIIEGLQFQNAVYFAMISDLDYGSESLSFKRCVFDSRTEYFYEGPVLYGNHVAITGIGPLSTNLYIADCTFIGPMTFWYPQVGGSGTDDYWGRPYPILVAGRGHVICYNEMYGYRDGFVFDNVNAINITDREKFTNAHDIYNNHIYNIDDDGIQLDSSHHNVRCMRNLVYNGLIGVSWQPTYGGPSYVYRNIFFNHETSNKTNGFPAGMQVFNNTFCSYRSGFVSGAFWQNGKYMNNLFIGKDHTVSAVVDKVISSGTPTPTISMVDYNGYYWHNTQTAWKVTWTTYIQPDGVNTIASYTQSSYTTLAAFTAAKGYEVHGLSTILPTGGTKDLVNYIVSGGPNVMTLPAGIDLKLTPASRAIDKGIVIPNITDGYGGTAPDMGAYEYGASIPTYGPR